MPKIITDPEYLKAKINKYTKKLEHTTDERVADGYQSKLLKWHKKYANQSRAGWGDMKKDAQSLIFSGSK